MGCGAGVACVGALRRGRWAYIGVSRLGGTDAIENSASDMILSKVARLMWWERQGANTKQANFSEVWTARHFCSSNNGTWAKMCLGCRPCSWIFHHSSLFTPASILARPWSPPSSNSITLWLRVSRSALSVIPLLCTIVHGSNAQFRRAFGHLVLSRTLIGSALVSNRQDWQSLLLLLLSRTVFFHPLLASTFQVPPKSFHFLQLVNQESPVSWQPLKASRLYNFERSQSQRCWCPSMTSNINRRCHLMSNFRSPAWFSWRKFLRRRSPQAVSISDLWFLELLTACHNAIGIALQSAHCISESILVGHFFVSIECRYRYPVAFCSRPDLALQDLDNVFGAFTCCFGMMLTSSFNFKMDGSLTCLRTNVLVI